jgi:hypothetical protein
MVNYIYSHFSVIKIRGITPEEKMKLLTFLKEKAKTFLGEGLMN